jgi:hypothetical protein
MTGRVTRQSRQRPPNCRLSRSDGRSQGRRQPARTRVPLTARRRGGYPLFRLVLIQPPTRVRFDGGNSIPLVLVDKIYADFRDSARYDQACDAIVARIKRVSPEEDWLQLACSPKTPTF